MNFLFMICYLIVFVPQLLSMGRRKFGTDFQLMFRIVKVLLFFGFVTVTVILFLVLGLTVSDLFAAILAFAPTGWAIILVSTVLCQSLYMSGAVFQPKNI